jgi:2,3-diketo-5-methylthio-1-phosphopentane phosphatase
MYRAEPTGEKASSLGRQFTHEAAAVSEGSKYAEVEPMTSALGRPGGVLVSDFDGTMTRHDFYKLAIQYLVPAGTPNYWREYCSGAITHFEALRRYYSAIRHSEAEVLAVIDRMELDPRLPEAVAALRQAGWNVVVTSAGCLWYIRRLLAAAGVNIEVHSNPGRFEEGRGLLMELPVDSPYLCSAQGIDKARVVRHFLDQGHSVAYAGDGLTDVAPARLVPDHLRFARADLADALQREGLPFHPFERWSEIAQILLERPI